MVISTNESLSLYLQNLISQMEQKILTHLIVLTSLLLLFQSFLTIREDKKENNEEFKNSPSKRLPPYLRFQKGMALGIKNDSDLNIFKLKI